MQCPKCEYEPTLAEIQRSPGDCVGCGINYEAYARHEADELLREQGRAEVREERRLSQALGVQAARPVVVMDINMSFSAMVRFMVMWALASIPALIILVILVVGLGSIVKVIGMF